LSHRPATFRQRDVTAAVKAAIAAGLDIARVEIDKTGKIILITGKPSPCDLNERSDDWADAK
jgi:hypothetical protein